jgi:alkylation response protein AidB-like acyl-CoA dehydrogenase
MDFDESPDEAGFRAEAVAWLDEHRSSPEALRVRRRPGEDDAAFVERARPWQALLADHGWAAITWPET